jgi:hypothetical protein
MQYNIINKAWHLIFNSIFILSISILITACPTPPEFDLVPSIEYEGVEFSQRNDTTGSGQILTKDVISLTISFEDGNGDLGFRRNEFNPPYDFFDLILDEEGELIFFGSSPDLPPFNYYDYFVVSDSALINNTLLVNDTILIDFNERYFNIYVSFFVNRPGSDNFEEFEWGRENPFYQPYHGRFPILNTEDYDRPLNGSLTYDMIGSGFRSLFRDYPMYLEVYILDRAGNKSNIVQTETFRLPTPQ